MGRQISVKKVMSDLEKAERFISRGLGLLANHSRILTDVLRNQEKSEKNGLTDEHKARILELDKLGGGNASSAIIASSVSKEFKKNIKPKQVSMFLVHQKDPSLVDKIQAGRKLKKKGA
jgi:hypothetical protein